MTTTSPAGAPQLQQMFIGDLSREEVRGAQDTSQGRSLLRRSLGPRNGGYQQFHDAKPSPQSRRNANAPRARIRGGYGSRY
jgi:hypothetical protein